MENKRSPERLDILNKELIENRWRHLLIKEEVTREDIAEVVAKWTGIPLWKCCRRTRKLLHLEELHRRVVGQEEGIEASDAEEVVPDYKTWENQWVLFYSLVQPALVKQNWQKHWQNLFDDENAMTRIDMSEYQERHSVSRLWSAPDM
jgi:ATP-dependent Clp protease ATP-binding subunit ClpB